MPSKYQYFKQFSILNRHEIFVLMVKSVAYQLPKMIDQLALKWLEEYPGTLIFCLQKHVAHALNYILTVMQPSAKLCNNI